MKKRISKTSTERRYNMDEMYKCSRPNHSCGKDLRRGGYTEEGYELKQCPQCYTKELMERTYKERKVK